MAGGRMHNPHPTPLDPPLAISYRNHQKSLVCFSHLAPLIVLFTERRSEKEGGHGPIPPLNTLLLWAMQKYFRSLRLKAEAWLK